VDREEVQGRLERIVTEYQVQVTDELESRIAPWERDLTRREVHEVIGGLLARQTSLVVHIAQSPGVWNGHVAPVLLRTMVDTFITLAWILVDAHDRSQKFILHGLGQLKLNLEHRAEELRKSGYESDEDPVIKYQTTWLNSQRFTFLTEVDLGSWSGISTREMAEQADCLDLYRYAYAPFSAATHSMWHHVGMYNVVPCDSPLHRHHGLPAAPEHPPDVDYLYRAAKYVEKSFRRFEEWLGVAPPESTAFEVLEGSLDTLGREVEAEAQAQGEEGG